MAEDPLDKLINKMRGRKPAKRQTKATRTLSLLEPQFTQFQNYCRSKGMTTSEVVDELIRAFMERIKDDIPPPDEK